MRQIRMLRAMRRGLETDYGDFYTGTQGETPDTAKRLPTDRRASPRPYQEHYHREWNHQGLGNALIADAPARAVGAIRRRPRLGGLLNYRERAA